jgi:hypothetical protein
MAFCCNIVLLKRIVASHSGDAVMADGSVVRHSE